jgi:glutamyl-tRNA synthetase
MWDMIAGLLDFSGEADPELLNEKWNEDAAKGLDYFASHINRIEDWTNESIKSGFNQLAEELGLKPGKLFLPLRIAITGSSAGPDLMLFMQILGRDACRNRLQTCLRIYNSII